MGARPSAFRKGGGFLNNVDGVWVDYQFTDEFNGQPFKPGKDPKTKKEKFHSLYMLVTVLVDGADEPITTTLFMGGYDDWDVSDDGHTLTPADGQPEDQQLGANTAGAKLIASAVAAGFPEADLSETDIEFTPLLGQRYRWVQRTNAEDTKRLGKRKGKDGKEYDRQDLLIDQYYGPAEIVATKGKVVSSKSAVKPAKSTKGNGKAQEFDLTSLSWDVLKGILDQNDGTIAKPKLSLKIINAMNKTEHQDKREDVRKFLFDDSNLADFVEAGYITYNKAKGQIALAAE